MIRAYLQGDVGCSLSALHPLLPKATWFLVALPPPPPTENPQRSTLSPRLSGGLRSSSGAQSCTAHASPGRLLPVLFFVFEPQAVPLQCPMRFSGALPRLWHRAVINTALRSLDHSIMQQKKDALLDWSVFPASATRPPPIPLSLGPLNMTLFVNRVFADVISGDRVIMS